METANPVPFPFPVACLHFRFQCCLPVEGRNTVGGFVVVVGVEISLSSRFFWNGSEIGESFVKFGFDFFCCDSCAKVLRDA